MAEEKAKNKSKFAEREEEILAFWQREKIFEKSLQKESPRGEFVFYDGPPFANGTPHYGHILAGTIKDVLPRYKTMSGYHVPRKWGWDCHGLPVENLIEKELNLKSRKDIEVYGVENFNKAAGADVMKFADEWRRQVPRLGRWVDMEADYKTMDSTYTESVWWAFKTLYDKGLVYQGFKSMQLCPRCETTLSNFEVSQGYKDITDISLYVKFELADEPGTFLLAWTTTPWTLPGNAALAVNPEIEYSILESETSLDRGIEKGELKLSPGKYIVASDRISVLTKEGNYFTDKVSRIKGSELVGKRYKPVFDYYKGKKLEHIENAWKVYSADFVTTETGTGIVHIAPAFGEDDYNLAQEKKLPFIQHVAITGVFNPEVKDFAGQHVKPKDDNQRADVEIIKNLAHRGLLFAKEKIIHSYPHCWRCDSPLLNYASSSWFVKVSTLRDKLVKANKTVSWVPSEIGEYRFGNWLANARDWAISRSRFWGAPIPVWQCDKCKKDHVVGSVADLKALRKQKNKYFVVRHGEAKHNVENRLNSGRKGQAPLTEKGREDAKHAAVSLKRHGIDLILSSPLLRSEETAKIISDELGGVKIISDERIREVNVGILDGEPVEKYRALFKTTEDKFTVTPEGGENLTDMKKRVGDFLYELDEKYEGKNILISAHEYTAWMLDTVADGADAKCGAYLKDTRSNKEDDYLAPGEVREVSFVPLPHNDSYELDLHRPYIDEVKVVCPCGGEMLRVPEVFDCWFESGSMPYASKHYPFDKSEFTPVGGFGKFFARSKGFPADFIAEGLDQTRGWFYSMLVLSVALFGKSPYKQVIVNGTVLAEDGEKMSKRLQNYPDPMDLVDKYGADPVRFYMLASPVMRAQDLAFSEKGVDEISKKLFTRLDNVLSFYQMYAEEKVKSQKSKVKSVLDRWVLSRLKELTRQVTDGLEKYELDRAARPIMDFVDDLSTWYLRRSRDRFKSDDESDKANALATTQYVLAELAKLLAPFAPFYAEHLYRSAGGAKESVHLESWASEDTLSAGELVLLKEMKETRYIVSLALEKRASVNIKVRQPLSKLVIKNAAIGASAGYADLIKDEVNVKALEVNSEQAEEVLLDVTITPELQEEGDVRELIRAIQAMRKEKNLKPSDQVVLKVKSHDAGRKFVEKYKTEISKVSGIKDFDFSYMGEGQVLELGEKNLIITI